jgi:hypothetical protein
MDGLILSRVRRHAGKSNNSFSGRIECIDLDQALLDLWHINTFTLTKISDDMRTLFFKLFI